MGRASQIIWYINAEKAPNAFELADTYTHIEKTEELKRTRYLHQLELNKEKKDGKRTINTSESEMD